VQRQRLVRMNLGRRPQRKPGHTQIRGTMGRTSPEFRWADQWRLRTQRRLMRGPTIPRRPRRFRRLLLLLLRHLQCHAPSRPLLLTQRAPRPPWTRSLTGQCGRTAGRRSSIQRAGTPSATSNAHTRATPPCPGPCSGIGRDDRSKVEAGRQLHPRKGRSDRLMRVTIASHARFSGFG